MSGKRVNLSVEEQIERDCAIADINFGKRTLVGLEHLRAMSELEDEFIR